MKRKTEPYPLSANGAASTFNTTPFDALISHDKKYLYGVSSLYSSAYQTKRVYIAKYHIDGTFIRLDSVSEAGSNSPTNNLYYGETAADQFNNIYISYSNHSDVDDFGYRCAKIDSSGNIKWTFSYDDPFGGYDEVTSIAVNEQQEVFLTGYVETANNGFDIMTIKLDSSGTIVWSKKYNGTGNDDDIPRDLQITSSGDIIVSAISRNTIGYYVTKTFSQNYLYIMMIFICQEWQLAMMYPNILGIPSKVTS